MKKVTVRIRNTFSYLGQVFNAVGLASRDKTLFHWSQWLLLSEGFLVSTPIIEQDGIRIHFYQLYNSTVKKKKGSTMFSLCHNIFRRNTWWFPPPQVNKLQWDFL